MSSNYRCTSNTTLHQCTHSFINAAHRHYDLQSAVLKSLPADQDILHVKSLADWESVLQAPRNNTITVDTNDVIVAQSLVIHPTLTDTADAVDMLDMELPDAPHTLSTFCAVMTHPDYRGQHLMQTMMNEWKRVAAADNRPHLLGCITRSNVASWSQFLNAGLVITSAGYDSSDGSTVYYAHRDMNATPQYDMHTMTNIAHDAPMDKLQSLFDEGYVGIQGAKQGSVYTRGLIMAKRL